MIPTLKSALTAAALCVGMAVPAYAQAINVMIAQVDRDPTSLERDTRIQNNMLNAFSQAMNAPSFVSEVRSLGYSGMDVYDERAVVSNFFNPRARGRTRRTDAQVLRVVRLTKNPRIDAVVLYTVFVKAVPDAVLPDVALLQMSLTYRALSVRDGRFLSSGTVRIDGDNVPFKGCAAQLNGRGPTPHCVIEFISKRGEKLAREAGDKLALQLASIARRYKQASGGPVAPQQPAIAPSAKDTPPSRVAVAPTTRSGPCGFPTNFSITFRGFNAREVNFAEENMEFWACKIRVDVSDASASETTFSYKTKASGQRIMRNIRKMLELMGQVAVQPKMRGNNEIIVTAIRLRPN